ncbi:histidine kinase [Cellulophaga sp. Z1A5H]|uniref:sensor histidine kinase n=1 Tax=Cellulophaga sp. Z1A5H TaxID=2687291 RepID=UPI0013FD77AF|nr:histidine kinase [Cellulophaga sp. Z1A5H]
MKTIKLHTLIFFLIVWSFSFGQQYKNYTINHGLPSNHVYRITQDYEGFIWFITDKGMVKFDGENFKTFTTKNGLPTNDVWDIKITKDNRVWYFSKSEKLGYIQNDSVYAFPSSQKGEVFSPNTIGQTRDSIVLNFNMFNYMLEGNVFKKRKIHKNYSYGRILGNSEIKYIKKEEDRTSFSFVDKDDKIIWSPDNQSLITSTGKLDSQLNDSLYYFIDHKQLMFLNLKKHEYYSLNFSESLKYEQINYQRLHNVNNEIQLTGSNFVAKISKEYGITDVNYLPEELDTHFSFKDKTGNIWAASFNKGVYFFPASKKNTKTYFLNEKVQELKSINHQIWASVYKKGLYALSKSTNLFNLSFKNDEYSFSINPLKNDDGFIYSTEMSVIWYKNDQFESIKFNNSTFKKNHIGRRFINHNNSIYSNVYQGINKLNIENLSIENFYFEYAISDFASLQNKLIIGTSSGLKSLVKDSIQLISDREIFKKPILKLAALNKTKIAVGTDGFGVYIFDGENAVLIHSTKDYSVEDIFVENEKSFWIATQKGVHQIKENNSIFEIAASFYESDGLLANKVNSITVKDSLLYVATDVGLTALNTQNNHNNQLQRIYIDGITFNGKVQEKTCLELDYSDSGNIQIDFGVIEYSNQDNLKKAYRLLPNQTTWINTSSNQINLHTLTPNKYTLELKATNHHGNVVTKSLEIMIRPMFWQTLWFKIVVSVIIGSLVISIVWFISKRIQFKKDQKIILEKELSEIQLRALRSQMNPHFVFNSLSAIQYFINENDFESSEMYLVKFSKLIRKFFELSKENEILISEEIELLNSYLEIEKLRFKEKLSYKIHVNTAINISKSYIPTMLLQPIVENAINHGIFNKEKNGLIRINFEYISEDTLRVAVMDDGVGYKRNKVRLGKKVKSSNVLKDRIHFLNQSRDWHVTHSLSEMYPEKSDKGSKVTFIIKHLSE